MCQGLEYRNREQRNCENANTDKLTLVVTKPNLGD